MTIAAPGHGQMAVPDIDWSSEGWTPAEKDQMLRWYMEAHGTGDTSVARFAPFMIQHNPAGFKRYRRHVRYHGRAVPGPLLFLHTYAVLGNGDGALYQMLSAKQRGFTKPQVLETLAFAFLTSGPIMNGAAAATSAYLFAWDDDGKPSKVQWPQGWAPDPAAFRSGMDLTTDEFTAGDLDALKAWHQRVKGEVPRWVGAWAKLGGHGYKTNRIRYEIGFGVSLPKQLFPLFQLHLATYRVWTEAARQALLHARALGCTRDQVVETMESAFTCGGEQMMAGVLTDRVIDVLESFPD